MKNNIFNTQLIYIILIDISSLLLFFINAKVIFHLHWYNEKTGWAIAVFIFLFTGIYAIIVVLGHVYKQLRKPIKLGGVLKIIFAYVPLLFLNSILVYSSLIFMGIL